MATVKTGHSRAKTAHKVAEELSEALEFDGLKAVLVFSSPTLDAAELATALDRTFDVPVFGCTTAGEIGPLGFVSNSVVAMAVGGPGVRVGAGLSREISRSPLVSGGEAVADAMKAISLEPGAGSATRHVSVCLIDGRSRQEESFVAGAAMRAPAIPLVGGSASDLNEQPAAIYCFGEAHRDAGLVLLFEIDTPFSVLLCDHMTPTETRVVVTESDPSQRLVYELNGRPAREVFSEVVGEEVSQASQASVGRNPLAMYVDGKAYVRSAMNLEGDAIRFACAIETGVVLRLVKPGDILSETKDALERARRDVGGAVTGMLTFNCLGRYFETEAKGQTERMAKLLGDYAAVGFNTFGEQFNALHANHTLTALVLGEAN